MFDHLKYLTSFIFPACVVWFLYTGPHDAVTALAWTMPLWTIILVDWLSPKIDPISSKHIVSAWFYDGILYGLSFLQFFIIALLLIYASQLQWNSTQEIVVSIVNLIVLRILVGTTSGSSAIIVAHELIHRPQVHMRILGQLLMYTVCYDYFAIAHIRGHHLTVATPDDIETAHLGESFNHYWKRAYTEHFNYAWNYELQRLGLTNTPIYHYKMLANTVLQGLILKFFLLILIAIYFGWAALFIFLFQALSGVRLLETINYYQHWGLQQGKSANALAWVNQSSFTEYALVGLSNHIGHHQNSATPFYKIEYSEQGPKMPYGYFVSNLWVKLNNKSFRRNSALILKDFFSQRN
ncbi:MAG: fatty acid desaturase [Methylococcales bacterium]|nr:fatty acid desaturase [Methylococcales bacterium]